MSEYMSEVLHIVSKIQKELMEKQNEYSILYSILEYITNGDCEVINYCSICIWSSENQGFVDFWSEEMEDYDFIKFEEYIRDEINKINEVLGNIIL
jgi:hypothetical protein